MAINAGATNELAEFPLGVVVAEGPPLVVAEGPSVVGAVQFTGPPTNLRLLI